MYEAFATLLDPGDEVLVVSPYWTTYPEAIRLAGGVQVDVGVHGEPRPPSARRGHTALARRVTPGVHRPSILELIAEREPAANAAAERLREQIASPTDQLTLAENELTELAVTRKTLLRPTVDADPLTAPADTTIASPAYQQFLAVSAPPPAECAKLKRLATRQILAEPEPGPLNRIFEFAGRQPKLSSGTPQAPTTALHPAAANCCPRP